MVAYRLTVKFNVVGPLLKKVVKMQETAALFCVAMKRAIEKIVQF